MNANDSTNPGKVYLVGAGPGNPGLLTLRAVECLQRADVVLFDYLANPRILTHVNPAAEQICLGRHGHGRIWTQDEINQRMVELAASGRTVVRLKGGDPAIFARGADEMEALVQHNIPFEVVPGITAALAAGSYAGIPVTHRDMASAVAFITGQEADKDGAAIDFARLADFPGTLVFYMGVTTSESWTSALIDAGKPPDTPAAIIRHCSWDTQKQVQCTLAEVASELAPERGMRPPVIVIIGEVATLAPTLSWFDQRPLFGRKVMITRPKLQAEGLCALVEELGGQVVPQPAIEIGPPDDWSVVDNALQRIAEFNWLVFSSSNGVRFLLDRLLAVGLDLRSLAGVQIAVVGSGTSEELRRYCLVADLQPTEFRAEALADVLADHASGRRFLLVRASRGREVLAQRLAAAGGKVEQVVAYQNTDVKAPEPDVAALLANGEIDWTTVTSSAIAASLVGMFGELLHKTRLASISPVTSSTLRNLGFAPDVEAAQYTMQGIVDAIVEADARIP